MAWPAVELLADLRGSLLDRVSAQIGLWEVPPMHASLFGSAARRDGDADSDIDLLLIRPPGVGEDDSPWADQVDRLRVLIPAWSGNRCQAFQLDLERLAAHVRARDPFVEEWSRDAITLCGEEPRVILRGLPEGGGR